MTLDDIDILARTIYGEARGEYYHPAGGLTSFIAVANVVMNRLKAPARFGTTIAEICQKRWQFSCWNKDDPNYDVIQSVSRDGNQLFEMACLTADKVARGNWPDITFGSNHYYAASMPTPPKWARGRTLQVRIGRHLFYRITS
jgi:spore germination cell wall hydrolase CwlJ-like protein